MSSPRPERRGHEKCDVRHVGGLLNVRSTVVGEAVLSSNIGTFGSAPKTILCLKSPDKDDTER
jgi:hypothetical protein